MVRTGRRSPTVFLVRCNIKLCIVHRNLVTYSLDSSDSDDGFDEVEALDEAADVTQRRLTALLTEEDLGLNFLKVYVCKIFATKIHF